MDNLQILKDLADFVMVGDEVKSAEKAKEALTAGISPIKVIENGLAVGMLEVSRLYDKREYALPELVLAAEAFYSALNIITPEFLKAKEERKFLGRVVCGVVQYDVHDIGMKLVKTLLDANGFQCFDLGKDVPLEDFIKKAKEVDAQIIAISALMTTTMPFMKDIVEMLKKEGLRNKFKVMVGGAPVSREWMVHVGADGYGKDAVEAVAEAKKLVGISPKGV